MKGYKAFNPDLTCRDMQYEVGKSYSMDEEPMLCKRGFHFCETIKDCSRFMNCQVQTTECAKLRQAEQ